VAKDVAAAAAVMPSQCQHEGLAAVIARSRLQVVLPVLQALVLTAPTLLWEAAVGTTPSAATTIAAAATTKTETTTTAAAIAAALSCAGETHDRVVETSLPLSPARAIQILALLLPLFLLLLLLLHLLLRLLPLLFILRLLLLLLLVPLFRVWARLLWYQGWL
jgi:hypothetical protein